MAVPKQHHLHLDAEVKRIVAEFDFPTDALRRSAKEFLKELDDGLRSDDEGMAQIPTYVTAVPNGTEKGLYMAVDLGGTNFRVCSIQLHGNSTFSLTQSKVAVPRDLMVAKTAKELFHFLARQIEAFLQKHHADHYFGHIRRRSTGSAPLGFAEEEVFNLGFTFSFPVHQIGINKGRLIRWTKGFDIKDAIGKDVCALLQAEIDELRLPVRVAALVNDTVGTLMARSYTSPGTTGTLLGAIFGTGTNGAYVETLSNIRKLRGDPQAGAYDASTGEMIVNTEWGSFDNAVRTLPNTRYDRDLDRESVNPGIQMFEKRVSGMFLGEVLRRAIVSLLENPKARLFSQFHSAESDIHSTTNIAEDSPLFRRWGLDTSFLSIAHGDHSPGLRITRQTLDKDYGISAPSVHDAEAVRTIASAVGRRAARLAAVAIGATIVKSGKLGSRLATAATTAERESADPARGIRDDASVDSDSTIHTAVTSTSSNLPLSTLNGAEAQAGLAPGNHTPAEEDDVPEDEVIDVGVDGSLVEFYPGFEDIVREALREIPEIGREGERRIRIGIAKDGSGVGAALIALVAGRAESPPATGTPMATGMADAR